MSLKDDVVSDTDDFFSGTYSITDGREIPDVDDIKFGKFGRQLELAMLFIDIRESTKIVDSFRRTTAARMYKAFLSGVAKIARNYNGELRSFNGDGVLVAFNGDYKCNNAVRSALAMNWLIIKVLRPKLDKYFENNQSLNDMGFSCGIGIEVGDILVVRGGIRGENNNDLVWVGNATNYAVKLADRKDGYTTHISSKVYGKLEDKNKYSNSSEKENMWAKVKDESIYVSNWRWSVQ